ncbi:hypothetical protein [Luteibacter sp.]|uniref:hypothetical protein n=1 Tax=Luteibacter sp. TaxID=1886636 RepID=UPI0028095551|nr:hypothetical protein [Luteibacter sp.]MDQ8049183.1 hypothetical protein [Luteibacter sp.]
MKWNIGLPACVLAALLLLASMPAGAGVVMNATRYVCRSISGWSPARSRSG